MGIFYSLAKLICKLLTFYRMFKSLRAGRSRRIKKYVTFCVVLTYLEWIEIFADKFVAWFPFYNTFKFSIITWLILAPMSAASTIYEAHIDSFFRKREKNLDFILFKLHHISSRPATLFSSLYHIVMLPMILLHGSAIFWLIGISTIVILGRAGFIVQDSIRDLVI